MVKPREAKLTLHSYFRPYELQPRMTAVVLDVVSARRAPLAVQQRQD